VIKRALVSANASMPLCRSRCCKTQPHLSDWGGFRATSERKCDLWKRLNEDLNGLFAARGCFGEEERNLGVSGLSDRPHDIWSWLQRMKAKQHIVRGNSTHLPSQPWPQPVGLRIWPPRAPGPISFHLRFRIIGRGIAKTCWRGSERVAC
jgi:hypothetical protein